MFVGSFTKHMSPFNCVHYLTWNSFKIKIEIKNKTKDVSPISLKQVSMLFKLYGVCSLIRT